MIFTATKNLIAEISWIYNIVRLMKILVSPKVQYSYIFHLVYMRTLILHSRAAIFGKRIDAYFSIKVQGIDCLGCCGAIAALLGNSKLLCIVPN